MKRTGLLLVHMCLNIAKGKIQSMIKLSIIIPHYNSVGTLPKLLDSIPERNMIEVIVIDDRSDQDTADYSQLTQRKAYRHVSFLNNNRSGKGPGTSRNIGLDAARGEWILFADSDDYFVDGAFDIVEEYLNTDYDVVFFSPVSIELEAGDRSDRHVGYERMIHHYLDAQDHLSEMLLKYRFVIPSSKMIRRRLIENNKLRFQERIAANDVMFSTMISYYMQKFTASEQVIYCLTKGKGTLTTKISDDIFIARRDASIDYYKFLQSVLSVDDFSHFSYIGRRTLAMAVKYRVGIAHIIRTYIALKKNKIVIFKYQMLNPFYLISKTCQFISRNRTDNE